MMFGLPVKPDALVAVVAVVALPSNVVAVIIPAWAVIAVPTFNVSPIVPIPLILNAVPTILLPVNWVAVRFPLDGL